MTVTTNRADRTAVPPDGGAESIDEQARRKGGRPIQSADDLAQDGVFDTDEELDAFLAHVAAMRHADSLDHPWTVRSSTLAACSLTHGLPLATLNVKDFRDFAEHEGLNLIIR